MIINNIKEINQKYKITSTNNSKQILTNIKTRKEFFLNHSKKEGKLFLQDLTTNISEQQTMLYAAQKNSLLIIIQGMDTSGKDGTVKHIFNGIDPHGINVINFKKPTERELNHDYLWRIHRELPSRGKIGIFNRSHYEDVVAVRVRKIVTEKTCQKRLKHIVNFEKMLYDEGTHILKFFLHISKKEQKERLKSRLDNKKKHWKFNPSDLTDRHLWNNFQTVYEDTITKTSTEFAPWFVIPADSKWNKNLIIASIILDKLQKMELSYPKVEFDPSKIVIK